jgi:putative nucleotidyltransferase with HDIG domain
MLSQVDKIVAKLGDLPAMPDVVVKVMELTNDQNVAVSEVSALIERDPALTAKLLKVSNSSYYGMRQVVGTLKLALVILGVREVRNIVLGISVLETLRDSKTERLLVREGLWKHSTEVASFAKKLGVHMELSLQGEDFIAGLLHDIGKLALWKQMNDEYVDVYKAAKERGMDLHTLEYEQFGFDHADAAAAIAQAWSLPESLSDALRCHHARADRDLQDTKDPRLSALVRIANLASKDPLLDEEIDPESLPSCTDEDAWAILSEAISIDSVEERFDLLRSFAEEMVDAQELSF